MSQSPGPQDGPPAAPRRPSLTDGAPAGGVPHKQLSVLAALDGKPPAPVGRGSRGALPWLLGLGGLVIAAIAVMVATRGPGGEAPRPAPVEVVAAPAAAPAVAPAPPAAAAMPAPPAASAAAVAAVEDLPAVAAVGAAAAATAAVASAEPAARPAQDKRAKPKPAPEKRTQVAQAKPKPKPAAKPGTAPTTTTASARAAKGATVAAAGTAAAAAATASTGDADVDLIAALVQHMNRQEAQGTARGEVTIAELVGRCKSLAGDDALRCQRRICENYWGRAEACPRSLAPRDVAARP